MEVYSDFSPIGRPCVLCLKIPNGSRWVSDRAPCPSNTPPSISVSPGFTDSGPTSTYCASCCTTTQHLDAELTNKRTLNKHQTQPGGRRGAAPTPHSARLGLTGASRHCVESGLADPTDRPHRLPDTDPAVAAGHVIGGHNQPTAHASQNLTARLCADAT